MESNKLSMKRFYIELTIGSSRIEALLGPVVPLDSISRCSALVRLATIVDMLFSHFTRVTTFKFKFTFITSGRTTNTL